MSSRVADVDAAAGGSNQAASAFGNRASRDCNVGPPPCERPHVGLAVPLERGRDRGALDLEHRALGDRRQVDEGGARELRGERGLPVLREP